MKKLLLILLILGVASFVVLRSPDMAQAQTAVGQRLITIASYADDAAANAACTAAIGANCQVGTIYRKSGDNTSRIVCSSVGTFIDLPLCSAFAAALGTANYIPFVSASTGLAIDTTAGKQFFRDSSTGYIGIGTVTPGTIFHLSDNAVNEKIRLQHTTDSNGYGAQISFYGGSSERFTFGSSRVGGVYIFSITAGAVYRYLIDNNGNHLFGTSDYDGTPAVGRITAQGTTNDGSTLIVAGRDSDGTNVYSVNTDGDIVGNSVQGKHKTTANCSSAASPAVCSGASAGSVVIAAAATTVTVNTTAVTANSQVFVQFDSSLGTKLSVTCNTVYAAPFVTARTAATSFAFDVAVAPVTNPACYSYWIVN